MLLSIPNLATMRQGRAFLPTDISGLVMWLKADVLTLNDGDPVATWTDSSGTNNDALQSTAGSKPLFKTGIINGLPTVLFDGSDDFMSFTSDPTARPDSVFIVTQPTLNTASQKSYACLASGSIGATFARLGTNFWGTFTNADLSSGNALVSGTNYLLENTAATGSTFLYQRGVQVATSAVTEATTGTPGMVGKDSTNANRQYAGHIAELIIYNTVLSAANRGSVETYLIAKYAL